MVSWSEAKRRLAILKYYKTHGLRKTMDQFNVANTQIQNYKEQIADLLAAIRKGRELDGKRNAKRPTGHAGRANERKAKKQKFCPRKSDGHFPICSSTSSFVTYSSNSPHNASQSDIFDISVFTIKKLSPFEHKNKF